MPGRPKILVVALELEWAGIARLPQALQAAGFETGAVCFAESYLAVTRFCDRHFFWPPDRRGRSLAKFLNSVVEEWHPDFLVAGDELTAVFFSHLFEKSPSGSELARLLKKSLGRPASVCEANSKRLTADLARQLGLRVPASQTVRKVGEIAQFARQYGFPVVVKKSFGCAGAQVAICYNEAEAAIALERLNKKPSLKERWLHWRKVVKGQVFSPAWQAADPSFIVTQFILGATAMSLASAYGGRMSAATTAVKVMSMPPEGPSCVVRFVQHPEMRQTTEKMIGAWGLSGFIGFDFIIDPAGAAWLLECNPRPTPLGHLGARVGEDLCRALYCQITGEPLPPMAQTAGLVVAHFPRELQRDPNSPYLTSAFHDIPTDDPDLLKKISKIFG